MLHVFIFKYITIKKVLFISSVIYRKKQNTKAYKTAERQTHRVPIKPMKQQRFTAVPSSRRHTYTFPEETTAIRDVKISARSKTNTPTKQ